MIRVSIITLDTRPTYVEYAETYAEVPKLIQDFAKKHDMNPYTFIIELNNNEKVLMVKHGDFDSIEYPSEIEEAKHFIVMNMLLTKN